MDQLGDWQGPQGRGDRRQYFQQQAVKMAGRMARQAFNKWASGKPAQKAKANARRVIKKGVIKQLRAGGQRANNNRGTGYTNSYAGTMAVASSQDMNKIVKRRGQGKPRGVIVVNKKKGKLLAQQKRKFNESTYSTYYIASDVVMDSDKNIGQLTRRYTKPSLGPSFGTGWIFNVGAVPLVWNPQTFGKIGNQVLPPNAEGEYGANPFYQINSLNAGLEQFDIMMKQSQLPETATPFNLGDQPIETFYTVPNTVLSEINLNLSFTSASVCDQLLTVQVVRNISSEPTVPGNFSTQGNNGGISNDAMIRHLCNHRKNASGKQLQILYTYTTVLKAINLAHKNPKVHYVKKKVKVNFSRSTCRRVSSAVTGGSGILLAGQYKPTFEIDQTGAQFNNCYVRAMSTAITKDVVLKKTANLDTATSSLGSAPYTVDVPQPFDMSTLQDRDATLLVNARFRYGGTISVKHYCKETSRGYGSATTQSFLDVNNQIAQLQSQIDSLTPHDSDTHEETDEEYSHTHPSAFTDPAVGYDEHDHPGTTTHSHSDDAVS